MIKRLFCYFTATHQEYAEFFGNFFGGLTPQELNNLIFLLCKNEKNNNLQKLIEEFSSCNIFDTSMTLTSSQKIKNCIMKANNSNYKSLLVTVADASAIVSLYNYCISNTYVFGSSRVAYSKRS